MNLYQSTLTTLTTLTVTAATLALISCGKKQQQQAGQRGLLPVPVASPVQKTIKLTKIYTGRFESTEKVDVRSRVSGYINAIHFREGQEIKEGDPMFSIDPSIFDAELANAEARITQVKTSIKLAQSNLSRATSLVKKNAISREEFDVRKAEYDQANANLKSAEAQLKSTQLNRDFADITAPISGVAGRYMITRGNYINGGNAGAQILTTIIPHNPIDVYFEVDERQVLNFTRLFFEGKSSGRDGQRPTVEISVSDSDQFEFKGELDYVENTLDKSTATMQMRARVNNDNKFLTPGLFAKVRVAIGEKREFTFVRESALGFDQDKRYAWVLQPDNTLVKTYVEIGSLEGNMRVIKSGLKPNDKIAIGRIQFLRPQVPVNAIASTMEPSKSATAQTKK